MPEPTEPDSPDAHGVHGSQRDDSKQQEEPSPSEQEDDQRWADLTETGGEAAS
jgi:hypothetical protein